MLSIIVMGAAMEYYLGHTTFKNRFQTSLMLYEIRYNSNRLINNIIHYKIWRMLALHQKSNEWSLG